MKKKNYNESYFENIDSESKTYFLGFICADGRVINDSNLFLRRKNLIFNEVIDIITNKQKYKKK
jgi:hypothetical protein